MTFTVGDIIFTAVASIVGTVATWYLCAALLGAFHGYIQQTAIEAVASSRVVDQLIQDSSRQSSRTAEALVVEGISKHESRYEHKERPQSKAKHYRIYDNCAGRCIELNDNVIEGQR